MKSAAVETTREAERASRLAELLACEEELAGLMEAVRADARRRVEAARTEAERADAELDASLEAEAVRVRREIEDGTRAAVRGIVAGANAQAARFDAVSDDEVARLAASALRLLTTQGRA
jgi:hypothetical protein